MITYGSKNGVKFKYFISREGENNKCYLKNVFWKIFKNALKLLTSPFLAILQTFFTQTVLKRKLGTQRALQGYSKGTRRALGHSSTQGSLAGALGYLRIQDSWALEALGHLKSTRALKALRH